MTALCRNGDLFRSELIAPKIPTLYNLSCSSCACFLRRFSWLFLRGLRVAPLYKHQYCLQCGADLDDGALHVLPFVRSFPRKPDESTSFVFLPSASFSLAHLTALKSQAALNLKMIPP